MLHSETEDCVPPHQTCQPKPRKKIFAQSHTALLLPLVLAPQSRPTVAQSPHPAAKDSQQCSTTPEPGCGPCSSPSLPLYAPPPPRYECPYDSPTALRRGAAHPPHALPRYIRNPAATAFPQCTASRCDRSRGPLRRPHAPRTANRWPPARSSASAPAQTTPAPDIPASLPDHPRAHTHSLGIHQNRKPRRTGSCCSPTLRQPLTAPPHAGPR